MIMQPIHILNQMGVLVSFSVAKKMTGDDIRKFFKQKKMVKEEAKVNEMLRKKIITEIHEAIENNEIPGLVTPQEFAASMGIDKKVVEKIPELNRLILVIAHKMAEKKYGKMSLCYFINTLVNMLNLSEEDFIKFHRQNHTDDENDDEDDNNTSAENA
jgi:hypothetical protein